jgi:tetratricopeptide (TPR) repeat protein
MGAVYLAERADGQYQQRVAVKLIKRGLDAELMLRRFRTERQILASLEHPNIARLLDGGTSDDGLPYFVMEYIAGAPINQFVRSRALAVAECLSLFLAVCDAVAHAHRRGVIHRDIKPANILVTPEGVPKLLDFGIAKALTPGAPGSTAPITGLRLLTPEYASPEQVEGRSATIASDVYSLGVVLYELLTGSSPYKPRSRDPLDIADAVRTTVPERPSTGVPRIIRRQLKGDLDTIILVALRKEPERRYQSVEDLAGDIRRHLHGLPITARPDSVRYRTGKFLKRNRVPALAALAAVLLTSLVGGGVAMLRSPGQPSLLGGPLAQRDRIVVSRFTEQQGDTMLAAAISEAFRIDLSQSPNVRVLTPVQVRAALRRMEFPGTSIPDDSVARDLAVREGAKAYVSGSIARVGGAWAVAVQLTSTNGSDALLAVSVTATDSTQLIAAVGRASRALRQRLGESLRDLRDMQTLEKATTASLPALRKYTEAYRIYMTDGDRTLAIKLYEEAIALDSGFAMAWSGIAAAYAALAEPGRAQVARMRALAHSNRMPYRDRGIQVAAYAYSRNDYQTTIAEYRRLLERYPDDIPVLNNLALAYRDARQFAPAETLFARAIAIDSGINPLYYGLHSTLVLNNKVAEGRAVLDIIRRRTPQEVLLPVTDVQQAAAEQGWDAAERLAQANRLLKQGDTLQLVDAYEQLAGIAMTQGRLTEAERYWHSQFLMSTGSESYGRRLFGAMQLGYLELRYNKNAVRARTIVDSVITLKPLGDILPADRPYEALARFYAQAGDVARARALLAAADSNNKALDRLMPHEISWTRGEIALVTGNLHSAEQELHSASTSHWCTICVLPSLARAYDAAGKSDLALATYRQYMSTAWLWRYENDAIEIGHVLRRMGELYQRAGQPDSARRVWGDLVRLWRNAEGSAIAERREVEKLISR